MPGLLYGPDPGFQPLRESVARWLGGFYGRGSIGDEKVEGCVDVSVIATILCCFYKSR